MGAAASIMALAGALGSSSGSAGSLEITTTNSTTTKSEDHTADGTFSAVGDVIIHDGWNQQNTSSSIGTNTQANEGTMVVAGGDVAVDVEVWGAAGGSGSATNLGRGGSGEYRKARMVLKPGTYYWMVGGGGGNAGGGSNATGGWGGGAAAGGGIGSGGYVGDSGTAFAEGGSTVSGRTQAIGAGGGGLTGLFGASTPSQADALLVAGGGGGYGYNNDAGRGGGSASTTRSATTSGNGIGATGAASGGAGRGGGGYQRGGGGGAGYYGGGGGKDTTAASGGGGMGFTVATDGHALVGTVSDTVTEAGDSSGNAGGTGSVNYKADLAESNSSSARAGRGGRIAITIVDLGG